MHMHMGFQSGPRRCGVRTVAHQLEREPLDIGLRLCLRRNPLAHAATNLETVCGTACAYRRRLHGPRGFCGIVVEERGQLERPHPRRAGRQHAAQPAL